MENRNRGVVLYGIGPAEKDYRVLRYYTMFHEDIGISSIDRAASLIRAERPDIIKVYVIDNYRGLRKDYLEAVKMNSFAGWIMFKDILERQGIEWPKHEIN